MNLGALQEDVILVILDWLGVHDLLSISQVSRYLNRICSQRVVWLRAFKSSNYPLPTLSEGSEPEKHAARTYKSALVRAAHIEQNWSREHPCPSFEALYNSPVSEIWQFRNRYLVTIAAGACICWDIDMPTVSPSPYFAETATRTEATTGGVAWGTNFQHFPTFTRAAEVHVKDTVGIVIAYPVQMVTPGCYLLYAPYSDSEEGGFLPVRNLPLISTSHTVRVVGLSSTSVAVACQNDTLLIRNLTTQASREINMTEDTVPMWIHSITLLNEFVLVTRHRNRAIVLDCYPLAGALDDASSQENDLPAPAPVTLSIPHAQTVSLSDPRVVQGDSRTNAKNGSPQATELDIVAALPSAMQHFRFSIIENSQSRELPSPVIALDLVGDDSSSREIRTRNMVNGNDDEDGYDSDSTPSRISQPTQVLDLYLSPSGKMAMAIQIAPHTNDRKVIGYLVPREGPLVAREWTFKDCLPSSQEPAKGETIPLLQPSSPTPRDIQAVLKSHACRVVFDELTGRVVVAADCEEIAVFQS